MKVKVSAVSYSNTLPFLKGLKMAQLNNEIELTLDMPSDCAKKLLSNEVDLGLVPVAIIPELKEHYIVSNYCIGASGKVDTVLLLSDVPLDEISSIYLDYQSRTSVALVRILADELWKISPEWLKSDAGYEAEISGTKAGVVIGDRAFELRSKFNYAYDLSDEWNRLTNLPFVFACWVSNKRLSSQLINELNGAFQQGLDSIDEIVASHPSDYNLKDYLTNKIDYVLDSDKKQALDTFLSKLTLQKV